MPDVADTQAEPTDYKVTGKHPFFKVRAKLGNQREAVEWLITPKREGSNDITMQGGNRIVRFDPDTGKGVMSKKGSQFIHLSPAMGAFAVEVPIALARAAAEAAPGPGPVRIT